MRPDVNTPIENPKLKALLNKKANTPETEQLDVLNEIFEEIAMNAYFLAVVDFGGTPIKNNPDGTKTLLKDTTISFAGLNLSNGTSWIPIFTDWEELRKWEPYKSGDVSTLIMSFDDVYSVAKGNSGNIVVNPFGDFLMMPSNLLNHIKQHKDAVTGKVQEQVIQKETKVRIGVPRDFPKQMTDAICAYVKNVKAINAIWLKLMMKGDEQSFLLAVDADGDARNYFQGIADAAKPHLPKCMYLDMVPNNTELGTTASSGEPFYKRKRGLFGLFN